MIERFVLKVNDREEAVPVSSETPYSMFYAMTFASTVQNSAVVWRNAAPALS
jgi:hypothetical protein